MNQLAVTFGHTAVGVFTALSINHGLTHTHTRTAFCVLVTERSGAATCSPW